MVLVFGDQQFTNEVMIGITAPVAGVGHDKITASNLLKMHAEASYVIVGFNDIDFVIKMSDIYRNKHFFLIIPEKEITTEIYKTALLHRIRVIAKSNCLEAINSEIKQNTKNKRQAITAPKELEQEILNKKNRTLKSHTIAITGLKGGVGKTIVAVSLSSYIATWAKKEKIDYKICLVDCDAEGARSAGLWLGITNSPQSLTVWSSLDREPSWMELEQLLTYHPESGLYVLPGPQSFQDALNTNLTSELAERIVNALRWHFDLIILDLGSFIKNATAVRTMQIASKTFIVLEPTLITLKLLKEMVSENTLGQLGIDLSRLQLVLNMNNENLFTSKDVQRTFGIPVAISLPIESAVKQIENSGKGRPPSLVIPKSKFMEGIVSLARTATENEMIPMPKYELWESIRRLFTRKRKDVVSAENR